MLTMVTPRYQSGLSCEHHSNQTLISEILTGDGRVSGLSSERVLPRQQTVSIIVRPLETALAVCHWVSPTLLSLHASRVRESFLTSPFHEVAPAYRFQPPLCGYDPYTIFSKVVPSFHSDLERFPSSLSESWTFNLLQHIKCLSFKPSEHHFNPDRNFISILTLFSVVY